MSDFMFRQLATNPLTYILIGCVCCLFLLGRRLDQRTIRLQQIVDSEDGAAYSLNLVLVTPFYTLLVCFVIELTLMLNVQIGVDYAAFSTARSAAVWLSAERTPYSKSEHLETMVGLTAIQAITPYASSIAENLQETTAARTSIAATNYRATDFYIDSYLQLSTTPTPQSVEYVANKWKNASRATRIEFDPPIAQLREQNPSGGTTFTTTIHYEMPFNIPGVGIILGKHSASGRGYVRELTSTVVLQLERPKTHNGKLGFDYDSRPAHGVNVIDPPSYDPARWPEIIK